MTQTAISPPKPPAASTHDTTLDVRSEPPARRHELIFETYSALTLGAAFVLVNDHDPKPLYYQFAAEYSDLFTWEYLEQGPVDWRVRIGKSGEDTAAPAALTIPLVELQDIATMVFDGLRIRAGDGITVNYQEAIESWEKLQATLKRGRMSHEEPRRLAAILLAIAAELEVAEECAEGE